MSTTYYKLLSLLSVLFASLLVASQGLAADTSQPGPIGFDVLFLIDDSTSMGTERSTKKETRSDPEGRRYDAATMIRQQLFEASRIANRDGGQQLDIRFSIIRFGTQAQLVSDWQLFNHLKPPLSLFIEPKDLVWTDFRPALALANDQFAKINDDLLPNVEPRQQVIILLTDGEPSIRYYDGDPSIQSEEFLYRDANYWATLDSHLKRLRGSNPNARVFVVALNNPVSDYWPKVKGYWRDLGVETVVLETRGVNGEKLRNEQLFRTLKEQVTDKLYHVSSRTTNSQGEFFVPCFQATMSIQVSFYNGVAPISLLSPDGKRITPAGQPNYSSSSTYMHFDVDYPTSGKWQILGYQGQKYELRYTVLPFSVAYVYPGAGGELLPTPNKIKMRFSKDNGEPFLSDELSCDVTAKLSYKNSINNGPNQDIELTSHFDPASPDYLQFESTQAFEPDQKQPAYFFSFDILSNDTLIFSSKDRLFTLSDKTAVNVTLDKEARYITRDELELSVRLQLQGYPGTDPVVIKEIFPQPDKSLSLSVNCPSFACSASTLGTDISHLPMTLIDPNTLGVTLILNKQGSHLDKLLDIISRAPSDLDIKIIPVAGAEMNDDFLFVELGH